MISVIIPTYKRSSRLPKAIDSVLNQTYSNIEIIIVDDNGDNVFRKNTKIVLEPYLTKGQIKYICHDTNQGGCSSRNTGAFGAKGQYISFLDDDDFFEPTKIEEQLTFLKSNIQLDACISHMFRIDENNNQIQSRENKARGTNLKETILDGNLFTSMLLIKKEVFINLGGFSEIDRYQDKYFHYKFLENDFKIGVLNKTLLTLVEHNETRISLAASHKIISSLNTLHDFELKHKHLFNKKEWKFIMHRLFYNKAYILSIGNFKNKLIALVYILKSLPFYNGKYNIIKLTLKCLMPNFVLKYKN